MSSDDPRAPVAGRAAGPAPGEGSLVQLRIPAVVASLRLLRRMLAEICAASGCSAACSRDIVIAVDEACQNIIQHAYGSDADGDIVIDVRRDGERMEIDIVDFAASVDPHRVHPRALDELRPGGLGTHFISECMDATEFRAPPPGAGNRLWMTKRIA